MRGTWHIHCLANSPSTYGDLRSAPPQRGGWTTWITAGKSGRTVTMPLEPKQSSVFLNELIRYLPKDYEAKYRTPPHGVRADQNWSFCIPVSACSSPGKVEAMIEQYFLFLKTHEQRV